MSGGKLKPKKSPSSGSSGTQRTKWYLKLTKLEFREIRAKYWQQNEVDRLTELWSGMIAEAKLPRTGWFKKLLDRWGEVMQKTQAERLGCAMRSGQQTALYMRHAYDRNLPQLVSSQRARERPLAVYSAEGDYIISASSDAAPDLPSNISSGQFLRDQFLQEELLRNQLLQDLIQVFESVGRKLDETLKRSKDMQEKLDEMEQKLNDMEKKLNKMEENQEEMKEKQDRMDGKLTDVEGKLTRVEGKVEGTQEKLNEVDAKVVGMESKLNEVESKLNGVETKLSGMEGTLQETLEQNKAMKEKLDAAEAKSEQVENMLREILQLVDK